MSMNELKGDFIGDSGGESVILVREIEGEKLVVQGKFLGGSFVV